MPEANRVKIVVPDHIRVNMSERKACNWILYVNYKCFRIVYVSIWYYFLPFLAIIIAWKVQKIHVDNLEDSRADNLEDRAH